MLIRRPSDIRPSEITDKSLFQRRREFLNGGAALALGITVPAFGPVGPAQAAMKFENVAKSPLSTDEPLTELDAISGYNNFYEFSLDKEEVKPRAKDFRTRPWTVAVEGEIANPKLYDIDELIRMSPLEERIYRLRCVEAWSMVIPWVGIPLATLIEKWQPTSRAKYVEFSTLYDPEQMPNQKAGLFGSILDWPLTEGLRIDEAMHPLTILGVGLYGDVLPNQNGAPIRLVVPWKYGFKSAKSIVRIRFMEEQPGTAWNKQAPHEYGFYANVNPEVDHPRWSQAQERRIGDWLKRPTLPFNGYAEQVASLYAGLDLRANY